MLISQISEIDLTKILYVFGSNEAGIHGKGSALTAHHFFGAEKGKGVGLVGRSYAIPTKDKNLRVLPLDTIHAHFETFLNTAELFSDYHFVVSKIGCGLAGYSDEHMIKVLDDLFDRFYPLFLSNVTLPTKWQIMLGLIDPAEYTIIAGSRSLTNQKDIFEVFEKNVKQPTTIVSGGACGVDTLAIQWADFNNIPRITVPAPWKYYNNNKQTGIMRNWLMSLFATKCFCVWDGVSRGTKNMQDVATSQGLDLHVYQMNNTLY